MAKMMMPGKVGQAIGNLQALKVLFICTYDRLDDDDDSDDDDSDDDDDDVESPTPDWKILARILSQVRQRITLDVTKVQAWDAEESQSLARLIRGHPTITCFEDSSGMFPYKSLDTLYSTLATLPSLESVKLSNFRWPVDGPALANPRSLTELLRESSLRSVCFHRFYFTLALYQATANALMERTAVNNLEFWNCSFSARECADMMTNGLARNTSVISITVVSKHGVGGVFFDALQRLYR
jgi:hypothetical protein